MKPFQLIIHGGAGQLAEPYLMKKLPVLKESLDAGWKTYLEGGTGEDVVASAIQVMEDCEYFNAGYGGYPNANKIVLLDAAMMNGDREYVAFMNIRRLKYPIRVVRDFLKNEKSLSSVWTHELMESFDFKNAELKKWYGWVERHQDLLSPYVEELLFKNQGEFSVDTGFRTVGACASDESGALFAGISTGGPNHKVNGRIGDAAMIGLGLYADNDLCAMTTTGYGEALLACFPTGFIIGRVRDEVRKDPDCFLKDSALMKRIIDEEFQEFGQKKIKRGGGIICIPKGGEPTYAFNTKAIPIGIRIGTKDKIIKNEAYIDRRDGEKSWL